MNRLNLLFANSFPLVLSNKPCFCFQSQHKITVRGINLLTRSKNNKDEVFVCKENKISFSYGKKITQKIDILTFNIYKASLDGKTIKFFFLKKNLLKRKNKLAVSRYLTEYSVFIFFLTKIIGWDRKKNSSARVPRLCKRAWVWGVSVLRHSSRAMGFIYRYEEDALHSMVKQSKANGCSWYSYFPMTHVWACKHSSRRGI